MEIENLMDDLFSEKVKDALVRNWIEKRLEYFEIRAIPLEEVSAIDFVSKETLIEIEKR